MVVILFVTHERTRKLPGRVSFVIIESKLVYMYRSCTYVLACMIKISVLTDAYIIVATAVLPGIIDV